MDPEEYVKNAWDIHVHASPSLFPRWGDAVDLASECSKHSMAGFVLKYHHGSSVEVASIANKNFGDIKIYGGVTLNYGVGGLNPYAVDTAVALGGKVVWLPTIHAVNHENTMGVLGGFKFQKSDTRIRINSGISVVNDQGAIKEELKDILDLISGRSVVLATGHVSVQEIYKVQKYIMNEGLEIPLLINHALFRTTELSEQQINELANENTWFETVYLTVSPVADAVPIKKVAGIIGNTSDAQWIIASDSGQINNIKSPQALSTYAKMLVDEGIEEQRVLRMLRDEPKSLLKN